MNRALRHEEQALRHEARDEARHGHFGAAAHLRHDANTVHNERDHLLHNHGHHGHGHHGHGHHGHGHTHFPEPIHHHHGHGHHGHGHHGHDHHGHHHHEGECCIIL